jgi:DNA-directed RNA polymerase specialized sigma24 family protein
MRRIHETPSAVASSPKATETRPLTAIDAHGADLSPTNREPQTPAEPAEGSPGDARLRARTLASFAELRPDQRMTLSLRILEELPYEQLAALLDLSLGVATLRLSQARGHILSRTTGLGGDA